MQVAIIFAIILFAIFSGVTDINRIAELENENERLRGM